MTVQLTAVVSGRVQGVGFRDWVRREALARGLTGWAANLRNGSVEVVAIGARGACEELLAALREGPTPGFVGGIKDSWQDAGDAPSGFAIR